MFQKNSFFDKSIYFRFTDEGILYYLEASSYYDGKKFSELALLSILKDKYPDAKISSGTDSTNKKYCYIVVEDEKVIYNTIILNKERLLKGKKFKILKASYLNEHNEFGLLVKIGKNKLGIGLHLGTLVIETCQMEGKPVMDCASFFNGQGRNLVGNIVE